MPPKAREQTPRITDAEMLLRVDTVMDLIVKGFKRSDIIRYANEKTQWGVDSRQIDSYISKAREAFRELSNSDREELRGESLATYRQIKAASFKVQDTKTALAAQHGIDRVFGLNAPLEVRMLPGVDARAFSLLAELLEKNNLAASDVINALIQQLSEAAQDASDRTS